MLENAEMINKNKSIAVIRGQRLLIMRQREAQKAGLKRISQKDFADKIHESDPDYDIITQQRYQTYESGTTTLPDEVAAHIVKAYPEYNLDWLLGYSDVMTKEESDFLKSDFMKPELIRQKRNEIANALLTGAINAASFRCGVQIGIKDIPENRLSILRMQLLDYADTIAYNMIDFMYKGESSNYLYHYIDEKEKAASD